MSKKKGGERTIIQSVFPACSTLAAAAIFFFRVFPFFEVGTKLLIARRCHGRYRQLGIRRVERRLQMQFWRDIHSTFESVWRCSLDTAATNTAKAAWRAYLVQKAINIDDPLMVPLLPFS